MAALLRGIVVPALLYVAVNGSGPGPLGGPSRIVTRIGIAERPAEASWRVLHGAGWLGGIGFTMSLFIAGLAFDGAALLTQAKLGILPASLIAGIVAGSCSGGRPGTEEMDDSQHAPFEAIIVDR